MWGESVVSLIVAHAMRATFCCSSMIIDGTRDAKAFKVPSISQHTCRHTHHELQTQTGHALGPGYGEQGILGRGSDGQQRVVEPQAVLPHVHDVVHCQHKDASLSGGLHRYSRGWRGRGAG